MIVRGPRAPLNGGRDQLDRGIVLADLLGKHAQQVQGVGMLRVYAQNLSVTGLGLRKAASLMMLQAELKNLGGSSKRRRFFREVHGVHAARSTPEMELEEWMRKLSRPRWCEVQRQMASKSPTSGSTLKAITQRGAAQRRPLAAGALRLVAQERRTRGRPRRIGLTAYSLLAHRASDSVRERLWDLVLPIAC